MYVFIGQRVVASAVAVDLLDGGRFWVLQCERRDVEMEVISQSVSVVGFSDSRTGEENGCQCSVSRFQQKIWRLEVKLLSWVIDL